MTSKFGYKSAYDRTIIKNSLKDQNHCTLMQCLGYMVYAANTQGDAMGYSLFGLSNHSNPQTRGPALPKAYAIIEIEQNSLSNLSNKLFLQPL